MEHHQNPKILDQDNWESMIIGEMWKSKDLESEQSGVHNNNAVSSVHLPGDEIMYDILFLTVSLVFFARVCDDIANNIVNFPRIWATGIRIVH